MLFKIVYLDDEIELCQIFSEQFSSPSVEIMTYQDPTAAVKYINKNPPDLVFLDLRLPKITGDEIAFLIDKNIPKALITGDLNVTPKYQFNKIFSKPYENDEIHQFINSFQNLKKAI